MEIIHTHAFIETIIIMNIPIPIPGIELLMFFLWINCKAGQMIK